MTPEQRAEHAHLINLWNCTESMTVAQNARMLELDKMAIQAEWQYRYDEALSLGRTEKQARIEADEWRNKIEHEQEKPNRTEGMPTLRN